jgi:hypothetical protein
MHRAQKNPQFMCKSPNTGKFISVNNNKILESRPPRLSVVQHSSASCLESSDPFIDSRKWIGIFLESSEKSAMNFNSIPLLAPEEPHGYTLPEFCVHEMIQLF